MKATAIFFLLIYFIISLPVSAQQKPLAAVAGKQISAEDFRTRYEMNPRPNHPAMLHKDKEQFLLSLLAEKLWAVDAENRGLGDDEFIKQMMTILEKMYIRDALFREEVMSKSRPTEQGILGGLVRSGTLLKANFLHTDTQTEIMMLYHELEAGADFDSLLQSRPEAAEQPEPIPVLYGQMNPEHEDILYSLNPGEFSKPAETELGWIIFRLADRIEGSGVPEAKKDSIRKTIHDLIEQRKTDAAIKDFSDRYIKGAEVAADRALFALLVEIFYERTDTMQPVEDQYRGSGYLFHLGDVLSIIDTIPDADLNKPLIKFSERPATLRDFLYHYGFEGIFFPGREKEIIAASISEMARDFIRLELIAREGFRRNYQNRPEIRKELEDWRDHYLAGELRKMYADSITVTVEEAYEFYDANASELTPPAEVNIIEIFTRDLSVVDEALQRIDNGEDIRAIAGELTERTWTKPRDGEFGFFPVTRYGKIGEIAATLELGQVYGPLELENGYSIFKLIDKREPDAKAGAAFDDYKESIMKNAYAARLKEKLDSRTVALMNKYNAAVNLEALRGVAVEDLDIFAYRFFGFGGRMMAKPITPTFADWYERWKREQQQTP